MVCCMGIAIVPMAGIIPGCCSMAGLLLCGLVWHGGVRGMVVRCMA